MHALDTSCYEARELATQLNAQSNLLCIDSTQLLRTQKVFANVHNATREPIDAFPELETLSNELKLKKVRSYLTMNRLYNLINYFNVETMGSNMRCRRLS